MHDIRRGLRCLAIFCVTKGCTSLQVTPTNVDIASVAPTYHLYTKEEIEEVISRL